MLRFNPDSEVGVVCHPEPAVLSGGRSRWSETAVVFCAQHPTTNCRDASPAKRDPARRDSTHAQRLTVLIVSARRPRQKARRPRPERELLSEVEPPRPEEEAPTEATIPSPPEAPAPGVAAELSDEDVRTQ